MRATPESNPPLFSMKYRRLELHGFSLIELLTTLAVIAILSAILIAVVGNIREKANSTKCAGNLRQMGSAFALYSADHNGRYPLPYQQGNGNADNNWWYHLSPYLGRQSENWADVKAVCAADQPLGCPSVDVDDTTYTQAWMCYKMPMIHRDYVRRNGGETTAAYGLPVYAIKNPAQAILVAEGRSHPFFSTYSSQLSLQVTGLVYPHANKQNVLFSDGHVGSFSESELRDGWDKYYTNTLDE